MNPASNWSRFCPTYTPTIWSNFGWFSLQDMHAHTISHNSSTALSLDKVEGGGWKKYEK